MKTGKTLGFIGTAVSVLVSVFIIIYMMTDVFKDDLASNPTAGIENAAVALKVICFILLTFAAFSFLLLIIWKEDRTKPLGEFLAFFGLINIVVVNLLALGFLVSAGIVLRSKKTRRKDGGR